MSTIVENTSRVRPDAGASPLVLRPDMAGTLMTPDEYDAAVADADDGHRYELVGGRLIVSPPVDERQRNPMGELEYLLRHHRYTHEEGHRLDLVLSQNGVRVDADRRIADLVVWAGLGRTPRPKIDPSTIAIEFVSKCRSNRLRDYVEKREEYLRIGAEEYWIFDRFERRLTVVRAARSESEEPEEIIVPEDGTYETPLLPGFVFPMERLLGTIDLFDES